jgi:hypothetical protein
MDAMDTFDLSNMIWSSKGSVSFWSGISQFWELRPLHSEHALEHFRPYMYLLPLQRLLLHSPLHWQRMILRSDSGAGRESMVFGTTSPPRHSHHQSSGCYKFVWHSHPDLNLMMSTTGMVIGCIWYWRKILHLTLVNYKLLAAMSQNLRFCRLFMVSSRLFQP